MLRTYERPLERVDMRTLMAVVHRNPKGKLPQDVERLLNEELALRRQMELRGKFEYKP